MVVLKVLSLRWKKELTELDAEKKAVYQQYLRLKDELKQIEAIQRYTELIARSMGLATLVKSRGMERWLVM